MKLVIFDMDGVLVDSELVFVKSVRRYLRDLGIEAAMEDAQLSRLTGRRTRQISEELIRSFGVMRTPAQVDAEQDRYFNMVLKEEGGVRPMEGIKPFLQKLKENGCQTALATSSEKAWVDEVMEGLKIRNYFDVVVTGEMVRISKPEPDIFLKAARLAGVAPEECVVIEDSVNGIAAGKRAGMYVIGFKGSRITQDTSGADQEVYSFAEIPV